MPTYTAMRAIATLGKQDGLVVAALNAVLNDECAARRFYLKRRQQLAARFLRENRKSVEGLGAPVAEIDMESYVAWQRREPGCWKNKQFLREFLRDNEAVRVKAVGTRTQFGHGTGLLPVSRAGARSVKRYE